jgi:acetyl esterase/lipase
MKMKLLLAAFLAAGAFAAEPKEIPLWPGPAPGSEGWNYQESEKEVDASDAAVPRKLHFIYNVTRPTMTPFLPEPGKANGTAVIVCPGGGFTFLAYDYEGTDVARWLSSNGVTAFVLKYRIARTGDGDEKAKTEERVKAVIPVAVEDGRQAMRMLRSQAKQFNVAPDRIGMMGFSAGGMVAAGVALSTDAAVRPNFLISIYSGIKEEVTPPEGSGPLFAAVAADDRFGVDRSVHLFTAWNKAKIPAELHIYANGGHGFSMKTTKMPVDTWTDRLRDWMGQMGFLTASR